MSHHEETLTLAAGESKHVSFDQPFGEAPTVTAIMQSGSGRGVPYVSDVTSDGCTVGVWSSTPEVGSFRAKVIAA